jgi:hypothetical protein
MSFGTSPLARSGTTLDLEGTLDLPRPKVVLPKIKIKNSYKI